MERLLDDVTPVSDALDKSNDTRMELLRVMHVTFIFLNGLTNLPISLFRLKIRMSAVFTLLSSSLWDMPADL